MHKPGTMVREHPHVICTLWLLWSHQHWGGALTAVKGTEGFILTAARIESGQQSHRSCALQRGWARMSYVQQYIQPGSDPQPWGDVRAGLHTPQQTAQVPGAGTGQHFVESVAQL